MGRRVSPLLHRDDPDNEPLVGHVKVTRGHWLDIARDVLVHHGMAKMKILTLSEKLPASRSGFHWYFENRANCLMLCCRNGPRATKRRLWPIANGLPPTSLRHAATSFGAVWTGPCLMRGRISPSGNACAGMMDFAPACMLQTPCGWTRFSRCLNDLNMIRLRRTPVRASFILCSLAIMRLRCASPWMCVWRGFRHISQALQGGASTRRRSPNF